VLPRITQRVAVTVVFVAAMVISITDVAIVNVALPTIGRDFGENPTAVDAVSISFLVSLAVFIPASGWLGDKFGGKRVLPVVSVAVLYGPVFAFVCALLGVVSFDFFFLAPQYHLELSNATGAETYVAFLATAITAGLLASRLRQRALDAARLAAEQESLRRIASLVGRGASPTSVMQGIAQELATLVGADLALLFHRDGTGHLSLVAAVGVSADHFAWPGDGSASDIAAMTATMRFDSHTSRTEYAAAFGPCGDALARLDVSSGVAHPVLVGRRRWGFVVVATRGERLPPSAERRVGDHTELLATAIDNAENRAELKASRARVITAADETRRKIERDLHDGAQQRLVSLTLQVAAARASVPPAQDELHRELSDITDGLRSLLDELREMARGLHPAILSEGGLAPALKALARRSPVPVQLDASVDVRLPPQTELTAYYIASEVLTNAAKHARARVVHLRAHAVGDVLELSIRDDGVGGAEPSDGSGLTGVIDRVFANDGTVEVYSPVGGGTSVDVVLPILGSANEGRTC
jgi:signal transduction histidine kinase